MKFKIKLTSKLKSMDINKLTILDDLEYKICRCKSYPDWESVILRSPSNTPANANYPWIFLTPFGRTKDDSSVFGFNFLYLKESHNEFYLLEPEK